MARKSIFIFRKKCYNSGHEQGNINRLLWGSRNNEKIQWMLLQHRRGHQHCCAGKSVRLQPNLKIEISGYVHDPALRKTMDSAKQTEKNRDRIECRTAYIPMIFRGYTERKSKKIQPALVQLRQNLNLLLKFSINPIKQYNNRAPPKRAISKTMLDCLLEPTYICLLLEN